jgi:hypothetical protein
MSSDEVSATTPSIESGIAARISRRTLLKGAAIGAGALIVGRPDNAWAQPTTAVTAAPPYVIPSLPNGVTIRPILTVGEAAGNGYRMVGIPDGLGAFEAGRNFTLLMDHELAVTAGIPRAHGSVGAFVSKWTIDKRTLQVIRGEDLTPSPNHVYTWNPVTRQYVQGTTAWDRLCSADLPDVNATRYRNLGASERIFFNGEETSPPFSVSFGRAWARIATGPEAGQAWELPRLGKMAFENVVNNPPARMFDNMTIDKRGRILIQEDTGNNPWIGKIWCYNIESGNLVEVARHNDALFTPGSPQFLTQDEESSGIIDAEDILGEGWFLFDVQAHYPAGDAELVQGGQLLAMRLGREVGR